MSMIHVTGNLSFHDSQVNQVTRDQYNDCTFIANKPDERRTIAEWLSLLNFESYQTKTFLERIDGTGQWLLESEIFQSWRDGPSGTLFCPGMPGSGKTVMSSIVIDHLRRFFHDAPDVAITFIYLDYKKQSEQTPLNLLSNLLKQLIQPPVVSLVDVGSLYQTHRRWSSQPTLDDVKTAINKEIAKLGKVFIVVDALDELSEENRARAEFLKAIHSLTGSVNLMVTSREIPSIMLAFQDAIRFDIYARDSDVKRYVRDWIPDWYPVDLQDLVIQQIPQRASGMFLLARLHMDALMECQSVAEVREAIHGLPRDITATYGNAIERIKQQRERNRRLAFAVLSWVTFAGRPLTVTELQYAVAVKPGMTRLTSEHAINETQLTSYCAGLIVIDDKTRLVRLVHYSTQEYFESKRNELFPEAQVDLAKTCLTYLLFNELQCDIGCDAQTLFRFWLDYPLLEYASRYWARHVQGRIEVTERTLVEIFLASPHRSEFLSRIALLDLHIANLPTNLSAVKTTLTFPSYLFRDTCFTILHLCAFFGLRQTIEYELANGAPADQKDSEGRTPLTWAAHNGHDDVLSFFINRPDVDVRSRDNYGRTPLCWAVRNSHHSAVELLLKCDAVSVNNQDCLGRTALYAATQNGNLAIVTLLLSLGVVDVNLRDHEGRTPLLRAIELGHYDVVASLLIRADIDFNAKDEDGHTPLLLAVKGGHHEVVRLLLAHEDGTKSHRVNINCTGNDGRTPLHWAAKNGCEAIMDLLLAHSALQANPHDALDPTPFWLASVMVNAVQLTGFHQVAQTGGCDSVSFLPALQVLSVNAQDTLGWTPLSLAAYYGYTSTVSLLLAHPSVDVNKTNQQYQTPLHLAVEQGHDGVVDLLLACNAIQVNGLDNHGETPLLLGARKGCKAIVKQLLACPSIDVIVPNQQRRTPLHLAVESGHDGVVDLLLAHDTIPSQVNALDDCDETPLFLGARRGHTTTVKKLLACSAINVMIPNHQHEMPLHLAIENGHDEIVGVLLDYLLTHQCSGSFESVNSLNHTRTMSSRSMTDMQLLAIPNLKSQLETCLHRAAEKGKARIVDILLTHWNFLLNSRDARGSTALSLAAQNGHYTTVKQLLAHTSIDVNLPNYVDQTPLHFAVKNHHFAIVKLLLANARIDSDSDSDSDWELSLIL